MPSKKLVILSVTLSVWISASTNGAFVVEADNQAPTGKASDHFVSTPPGIGFSYSTAVSSAVGLSGNQSVFGNPSNNTGPDRYEVFYTPGTDADNTPFVAGTFLGNSSATDPDGEGPSLPIYTTSPLLANGNIGGASGLYHVYFTIPSTGNVNPAGSKITIYNDGDPLALTPVLMNDGDTGPDENPLTGFAGGANNLWLRLGTVRLLAGHQYSVVFEANANPPTFVSQRLHGVMWEYAGAGTAGCGTINSGGSCAIYDNDGVVSAKNESASEFVGNDMGYEPPDPLDRRYQIEKVIGSEGNFAALNTNGLLAAWNHTTSLWNNYDDLAAHPYDQIQGRFQITDLKESGGNFAASNNNGEIAIWQWNGSSDDWSTYDDLGSHPYEETQGRFRIEKIIPSAGNFAVFNNNGEVAVWNHDGAVWSSNDLGIDPQNVNGRLIIKFSVDGEGNFAFANNKTRVSAWNQDTSDWTDYDFGLNGVLTQVVNVGRNFVAVSSTGAAAVWKTDMPEEWTGTDLANAVQLATGAPPQPNTWTPMNATEFWSATANWGSQSQPEVGSIINLANTDNSVQELIVDTRASGYSVNVQGSNGTMRLSVASEASLSILQDIQVHTGGEVQLSGGSLNAATLLLADGALHGTGVVKAKVTNAGVIRPGAARGIITVQGEYEQTQNGTLEIELGGTLAGEEFDQLTVADNAMLGGTLQVTTVDSFVPVVGDSFTILNLVSVSGAFTSIVLPELGNSLDWDTSELYTSGVLTVIPVLLPSDFNQDGAVNTADYVVWRKGVGVAPTQDNYNLWHTHFGQNLDSGSGASVNATVPEPATLVPLIVAAAGVSKRRRWCRQ